MTMQISFVSHSSRDTIRYGRVLGETLRAGCVLGLIGELGSGKTCFVKGIAAGVNNFSEDEVTSPTFTILQEYEGRIPLYHVDAYRLAGPADLDDIGFEDCVAGEGIAVIEWADRIREALPADCLLVRIECLREDERCFILSSTGEQHSGVLKDFSAKIEVHYE